MYCPKCRKPLFDENKCRYCDWTKVEVQVEPTQQTETVGSEPPKMPKSYYIDSFLLIGLCLAYGIIRIAIGASNGFEKDLYKGIVACLASLIFIPNIKVVNNATVTLLVKIAIAALIIIFI